MLFGSTMTRVPFRGCCRSSNQAAEIWTYPTCSYVSRTSSILSLYVWTAKRSLSWTKICQWLGSLGRCTYIWLRSQSKSFFADGIRRLVNRYTTYFENKGHHFEKWYNLLLSQVLVHEVNNKFSLVLTVSRIRNLITRCLWDIDLIDCKSVAGMWGKNIVCCVKRVESQ